MDQLLGSITKEAYSNTQNCTIAIQTCKWCQDKYKLCDCNRVVTCATFAMVPCAMDAMDPNECSRSIFPIVDVLLQWMCKPIEHKTLEKPLHILENPFDFCSNPWIPRVFDIIAKRFNYRKQTHEYHSYSGSRRHLLIYKWLGVTHAIPKIIPAYQYDWEFQGPRD